MKVKLFTKSCRDCYYCAHCQLKFWQPSLGLYQGYACEGLLLCEVCIANIDTNSFNNEPALISKWEEFDIPPCCECCKLPIDCVLTSNAIEYLKRAAKIYPKSCYVKAWEAISGISCKDLTGNNKYGIISTWRTTHMNNTRIFNLRGKVYLCPALEANFKGWLEQQKDACDEQQGKKYYQMIIDNIPCSDSYARKFVEKELLCFLAVSLGFTAISGSLMTDFDPQNAATS